MIFGYNGEEYTEATGLQYLRQRHYAPDAGIFLAKDSYRGDLYEPASQNRYGYAENDPGGDKKASKNPKKSGKGKTSGMAVGGLIAGAAKQIAKTARNVAVRAATKTATKASQRKSGSQKALSKQEAQALVNQGIQAMAGLKEMAKSLQTGVSCKGSKGKASTPGKGKSTGNSSKMGGSNRKGADKARVTSAMQKNFSWEAYLGAASWFIPGGAGLKVGSKVGAKFLTSKAGRAFIKTLAKGGKGSKSDIKFKGLSNVDARKWYLKQESKIPELIDKNLTIEQQAKQAFNLRNQYRTKARELMSDQKLAESLFKTDPNVTWEQLVQKQIDRGLSGDDIYKAIIESSQRSRTSVNEYLGLK